MKLSSKLITSYLGVAFLVLLVGSGSFFLNKHIKDHLIGESRQSIEDLERVSDLGFYLQNSLLYTRNYLFELSGDGEQGVLSGSRSARERVENNLTRIYQKLEEFQDGGIKNGGLHDNSDGRWSEIREQTDSLQSGIQLYHSLIRELFDLEGEPIDGDEIFNLTIEPYFRLTLLPVLEQLREIFARQVTREGTLIQQEAERTGKIIVVITIIGFVIATLLAWMMHLSITRPLKHLMQAADEIGSGNLDKRIEIDTRDELQQLGESFNRMTENLNISMVSREYVNNIIQSMGDMLFVTDESFTIEMVNEAVKVALGYEQDEIKGEPASRFLDKKYLDRVMNGEGEDLAGITFESILEGRNKKVMPVLISCSKLYQQDSVVAGYVFVASDITVQKEAEEKVSKSLKEKEVLLAEIHHRVKNNLAVISGLLEMQVWNLEEGDQSISALKESQLRIQSIALVHELLYQSETLSEVKLDEYTVRLLSAVERAHKSKEKPIRIITNLDPVRLTIRKAIPASLLLNELVVNAYKHAFADREEGTIWITLVQDGKYVELRVHDNGAGLPEDFDPFRQKSLGMTLIKTLVRQISATLDVEDHEPETGGACFTIRFEVG